MFQGIYIQYQKSYLLIQGEKESKYEAITNHHNQHPKECFTPNTVLSKDKKIEAKKRNGITSGLKFLLIFTSEYAKIFRMLVFLPDTVQSSDDPHYPSNRKHPGYFQFHIGFY